MPGFCWCWGPCPVAFAVCYLRRNGNRNDMHASWIQTLFSFNMCHRLCPCCVCSSLMWAAQPCRMYDGGSSMRTREDDTQYTWHVSTWMSLHQAEVDNGSRSSLYLLLWVFFLLLLFGAPPPEAASFGPVSAVDEYPALVFALLFDHLKRKLKSLSHVQK